MNRYIEIARIACNQIPFPELDFEVNHRAFIVDTELVLYRDEGEFIEYVCSWFFVKKRLSRNYKAFDHVETFRHRVTGGYLFVLLEKDCEDHEPILLFSVRASDVDSVLELLPDPSL